jgi:hypothetical protein
MDAITKDGGYKPNDVQMTKEAANKIGYDYVRYAGKGASFLGMGGKEEVEWRLVPKEEPTEDTIKNESLPAAGVAQLKPGKLTTFKNGQVWQLKNGKPVRVK